MKKYFIFLLVISVGLGVATHSHAQAADKQDSLVLVDLYNSTDGPDWTNNAGWLAGPVSSWFGITLNKKGKVTKISFHTGYWDQFTNNNLTGAIPSSLGNLTDLNTLDLSRNNLTNIPSSLGNLTNLTSLNLSENKLTGSIPSSLGSLTNLTSLDLSFNSLTGSIPLWLSNLTGLNTLDLSSNKLTGSISYSLGNINLMNLGLSDNLLNGKVPYTLGHYYHVYLDHNQFTFEGMADLISLHSYENPARGGGQLSYYNQAQIPIHQQGYTLSVSAGGKVGNNTYNWTDVSNSEKDTTITGDSTFTPTEPGLYKVEVTNSEVPGLTLSTDVVKVTEVDPKFRKISISIIDPYPHAIREDGSVETDPSKIIAGQAVTAVATDGITKLLLVVNSDQPVKFSIPDETEGLLSNDQKKYYTEVTGEPHNGKVVVVYRAPDGYGNNLPLNRKAIITAAVTGSSLSTDLSINLITPPVVMVHGLWSDQSMWKEDGFTRYLTSHGFVFPILADYGAYNASSFNPENSFIPGAIAVRQAILSALKNYRNENIAVTQVDVVAHSMGGLMTRSYIQQQDSLNLNFFKGFVHKLITIGTPYWGSPLGPALWDKAYKTINFPFTNDSINIPTSVYGILAGCKMPVGQALADFYQFSPAMQAYTPISGLKVFAILGTNGGDPSESQKNKNSYFVFNTFLQIILNESHSMIFKSPCNGSEMNSDLIVTTTSQRGGISKDSLFYKADHTGIISHLSETVANVIEVQRSETTELTNDGIKHEVLQLLLSNNPSDFANSIPAPSDFPADCGVLRKMKDTNKVQTISNQELYSRVNPNQYIKLTSPVSGNIYSQDSQAKIKLAIKAYGGLKPKNVLYMVKDISWFIPSDPSSDSVTFDLPKDAQVGNIKIIVLANDSLGNIYADTSHIFINPSGTLDSLSVFPASIQLDSLQRNRSIFVEGYFISDGDTIVQNLTDSSTGIEYAIQNGNKVFKVNKNGLITAIGNGGGNLLIKYKGKSLSIPVTVSGNFNSRTMYANAIDFPSIEDKTLGYPPFVLAATATSGGDVTFSVVSGPAKIENGILTITGIGKMTVKASQDGDAYFKAAPDVTRSFLVKDLTANFKVSATGATCKGSSNGAITILAAEALDYTATITGKDPGKSYPFTDSLAVNDLTAGTYHVDISVKGYPDYKQSYDLVITEPKDLSVYVAVHPSDQAVTLNLAGARTYAVNLNGRLYTTAENTITLPLAKGNNLLMVSTDKACQGIVKKSINISGKPEVFPNPFDKTLNVDLGKNDGAVEIVATIANMSDGRIVYNRRLNNQSGILRLDVSGLAEGAYILRLNIDHSKYIFKIIKIEK